MAQQQRPRRQPAGGGIGAARVPDDQVRSRVHRPAGRRRLAGFRRVLKVDSEAVEDTLGSLNAVLACGAVDDYSKARNMLADSARFNLGTPRTINLPNLPLEFLHPRHADALLDPARRRGTRARQQNNQAGPRRERDTDDHPRLRRQRHAQHRQRVCRARNRTAVARRRDHARSARDAVGVRSRDVGRVQGGSRRSGLLVPATMHEVFFAGQNRKAHGDADYSNYRRFQTSARIVPQ